MTASARMIPFLVLTCVACSTDLERSKAAELIRHSAQFSQPLVFTQTIGVVSGVYDKNYCLGFREGSDFYNTCRLRDLGFVALGPAGCSSYGGCSSTSMTLTEQGKLESKQWVFKGRKERFGSTWEEWSVPLASRELVEVTGIVNQTQPTRATEVHFTWKWVPNTLGHALKVVDEGLQQGTAVFQLYDDGWRLVTF